MALALIPIMFTYKVLYAIDEFEQLVTKQETAFELIKQVIEEDQSLEETIESVINIINASIKNPTNSWEKWLNSVLQSSQLYSAIIELNEKKADFLYIFKLFPKHFQIMLDNFFTKKLLIACGQEAQRNPEIFFTYFCSNNDKERLPFITRLSEREYHCQIEISTIINNETDSSRTLTISPLSLIAKR